MSNNVIEIGVCETKTLRSQNMLIVYLSKETLDIKTGIIAELIYTLTFSTAHRTNN